MSGVVNKCLGKFTEELMQQILDFFTIVFFALELVGKNIFFGSMS